MNRYGWNSTDSNPVNSLLPRGGWRPEQRRGLFYLASLVIFFSNIATKKSKIALGRLICRLIADEISQNKQLTRRTNTSSPDLGGAPQNARIKADIHYTVRFNAFDRKTNLSSFLVVKAKSKHET